MEVELPVTVKHLADVLSIKGNVALKVAWIEVGFGSVNINSKLKPGIAILLAQKLGVELRINE